MVKTPLQSRRSGAIRVGKVPEKGMTRHSSILAWRSPGTEDAMHTYIRAPTMLQAAVRQLSAFSPHITPVRMAPR